MLHLVFGDPEGNELEKPLMKATRLFWRMAGLGVAWMAAASSAHGQACAIGPVVFEAPVCETTSVELGEGRGTYAEWKDEAGVLYQVTVIAPRRALKFSGYLGRWRHNHKCGVTKLKLGDALRIQARTGETTPPQTAWSGSCAGGDAYITRAVSVGKHIVELNVSKSMRSQVSLDEAFVKLLAQTWLDPAPQ